MPSYGTLPGSASLPPLVRALLVIGFATLACAFTLTSAEPVYPCTSPSALRVAVTGAADATWYSATNPPPALTGQVPGGTQNLYPGASCVLVARVKNLGTSSGVSSIAFADLVDSGGEWTEPEKQVQPLVDTGDLSANLQLSVTYTSSLRPSTAHEVARGTLKSLAVPTRAFRAPVSLTPYMSRGREIGTWRIAVVVPTSADNRIQGDLTSCTVRFALAQATH
jgi:hypothetical protein